MYNCLFCIRVKLELHGCTDPRHDHIVVGRPDNVYGFDQSIIAADYTVEYYTAAIMLLS